MSRKPIFTLRFLAVVIFLGACSQRTSPSPVNSNPSGQTTSPSQTARILPKGTSCGIGLLEANVRIWIEGQDAQKVCGNITAMIRQQGKQPTGWDGKIPDESASDYRPVCSDAIPALSYEVVDTGGRLYGTEWCKWMVQTYGGSGSVTAPDLFGIISASQKAENTRQQNENAAIQATEEAQKLIYKTACKQHNGYIENGHCVVDYPGWSSQSVTIDPDGTWNAAQADINRGNCQIEMQNASAAAQGGRPWTKIPQYHPDTGVCVHGNP